MPKFLENKLKAEAASRGMKGRRAAAYVYGTMNNMGAMHGSKTTAKGERMEAKHERDMGYKGEAHSYDHKRPTKKIVSRYK